jgi:4a-hydroxytetrahydrobiopterin dehydratase
VEAPVLASVIVPTRNRPERLLRALRSVLAQDDGSWEAIVVDDGDGEGTAAAASLGDRRIRALANAGSGLVDARMTAISSARGELVCWLDDDDWWDDPGHLTLLRGAAAAGDSRFFFRGGWIVHEEDGRREVFDHDATPASLRENNTVLTSGIAYRATLHSTLGPLDRELGGYCDWDFMLRMCDAGVGPHKLPGLGVCYAVHGANASKVVDAPARLQGFERFADKHALDVVVGNHVTIHRLLMSVPEGWSEVEGALEREFRFNDFRTAIGFVERIAEIAEDANHHPDIAIHYNRVTLRWWTHTAGGITDRDRELAERSSALA